MQNVTYIRHDARKTRGRREEKEETEEEALRGRTKRKKEARGALILVW